MAGIAKPNIANLGPEVTITILGSATNSGTSVSGLFNGTTSDNWNTSDVAYFVAGSGNYIEFNLTLPCNIWRSGTTSWKQHCGLFTIYKYNGTSYDDITSSITQSATQITESQCEKTISNLQPGRYKFVANATMGRLDSEWYIERINFPLKTSINDIKNIGDCIKCRYTSTTSGNVGYFSELGTTIANLIPATSSATPDGSFYWTYVGKDYLGRKKFIADRNIQHSISWDTLNSMDLVNGSDWINPNYYLNRKDMSAGIIIQDINSLAALFPTNSSAIYGIRSNKTIPVNGKYYWEVYVTRPTSNVIHIGVCSSDYVLASGGSQIRAYRCVNSTSYKTNGTITSYGTLINGGDVVGVMLDMDNGTIEFTRNGVSQGVAFTDIKSLSNVYPLLESHQQTILKINFGKQDFKYTIPTGYTSLETKDCNNFSLKLLTGGTSATDTDNEWDQIIVNSNLNNTITAGDNNIWNWNGVYSWTLSTQTSTNYGSVRGFTTVSSYQIGTKSSSATNTGFRPVMLVQTLISASTFSGNLLASSIHNQDAILTGSIIDTNNPVLKVQYKILLNDTQIYPDNGFTDFTTSPTSINYSISNSLLINTNNKITIIMNNEQNKTSQTDFYATLYNNMPNGILTLSNTTTHADNINLTGTITDTDLDMISYRILINDVEKLPWSAFVNDPYIDYIIQSNDLNIGDNIIKVEYKDNYKNMGLGNWMNKITKTNQSSIINCQYINGSIIGTIDDPESDLTQYKILINDKQIYPLSNYTEFEQINNINYQINRNDILINKNNTISIIAQDNFGAITTQNITFIGDYVGLMFMDENKQFYTTDIGELLKYLDFGTITLGTITEPVKILVQNKFGFQIKDIDLKVINSLPNINVEFSKESNPFIATSNLILNNTYDINDIDYFYIRLNTSISPNSVSGVFEIVAKATSLSE